MFKEAAQKTKKIGILLGSTRQGRNSPLVAQALLLLAQQDSSLQASIIDPATYQLPFLYEELAPAHRVVITDARIKAWSELISSYDAFVFVVPEYNSGYPGVLKNALDLLYKEWNGKPVILVGYSGGHSGGAKALGQLTQVVAALRMKLVEPLVTIPFVWKALTPEGRLADKKQEELFLQALTEICK